MLGVMSVQHQQDPQLSATHLKKFRPIHHSTSSGWWASSTKEYHKKYREAALKGHKVLTLVLPRGWLLPPQDFFLPPQKQKESDKSHLGFVNYILCGHFDEKKKKTMGYPLQGG